MISSVDFGVAVRLTFPQYLKMMRDRAGLSQRELAEKLSVKTQTVGNWEGGRSVPRLTPAQTHELCQMLGVSLASLASGFLGQVEVDE